MTDKDKILLKIANTIVANLGNITFNGFLTGRIGVAYFLFSYAKYSNNSYFSDIADSLIELAFNSINGKEPIDARHGRASVSIGLMQMAYYSFIEIEEDSYESLDKNLLEADVKILEMESTTDAPVYTQGIYLAKSLLYRKFSVSQRTIDKVIGNMEKFITSSVLNKRLKANISMLGSFVYVLKSLLATGVLSKEKYDDLTCMIKPFIYMTFTENAIYNANWIFKDLFNDKAPFNYSRVSNENICFLEEQKVKFFYEYDNVLSDTEIGNYARQIEEALNMSYFNKTEIYCDLAFAGINLIKNTNEKNHKKGFSILAH